MRKQIMIVGLALVVGIGSALPAVGQEFELVGYTDVNRNGAAGVVVFHNDCADDHGPTARACTSADLIRGAVPDPIPADPITSNTNWVLPSIVTATTLAIDASGKQASPVNLSCDGWNSSSSAVTGLSINQNGRFTLSACNGARNVACCVPVSP